jgi:hypothetical protein
MPNDPFWKDPTTGTPATEAALRAAEERLEIELPEPLRALYAIRNGGLLVFDTPLAPFGGIEPVESLETLRVIGEECDFPFDEEDWNLALPRTERLIVFARSGYDDFFCLDYRDTDPAGEPAVVRYNTALEPRETQRHESFTAFVEELRTVL